MSAFILNGDAGTTSDRRRVLHDVVYSHAGDTNLSMDGELPLRGEGPFPAVILVHGGGWIRGERTTGVSPLFQPLRDAGIAWFSISYRLASDYSEIGSAVQDVVAAGHFLRNYKGKCENPHGHNYRVRITLAGKELDKAGLLLDFKDLREVMKHVIDRLDHQMINDLEPFTKLNPSAENLARYFYEQTNGKLRDDTAGRVRVKDVTIWETDETTATYFE